MDWRRQARVTITQLDREILELETSLAHLRERRTTILCTIAPVKFIPSEILEAIFKLLAHGGWDSYELPYSIRLSHVNRRWRKIAINLSSLWSVIRISPKRSIDLISLYLERCGEYPLDVTFEPEKSGDFEEMVKVVVPHLAHLRCLSVKACSDIIIRDAVEPLADFPARHLESLVFEANYSQYANLPFAFFAGGLPLLTSTRICGFSLPWDSPLLAGLTSLDLDCLPWDDGPGYEQFRDMIIACPNLECLRIAHINVSWLEVVCLKPVIHIPTLQSLTLHLSLPHEIISLCKLLSTPALKSLTIIESVFNISSDLLMAGNSHWYRYPVLECLKLSLTQSSLHCQPDDFLRSVPMISSFSLEGTDSDMFVSLLKEPVAYSQPSLDSLFLPNLRTITVVGPYNKDLLIDMLSARHAVGCPISTICLSPSVLSDREFIDRIYGDGNVKTILPADEYRLSQDM